ncbi:MAG: hypothetical protein FWG25_02805, partial [Promicromonosporaceae bacterium]|nr:hypothetical protein [Promicromonosporaceae bacterium]
HLTGQASLLRTSRDAWNEVEMQWFSASQGTLAYDSAEFTAWEISLALADLECRQQTGVDAQRREIELMRHQEFVDRLGTELEAWAQYEEAQRAR